MLLLAVGLVIASGRQDRERGAAAGHRRMRSPLCPHPHEPEPSSIKRQRNQTKHITRKATNVQSCQSNE